MKRKKLTNKQVKRILRQAGAAHRHQAAVSEPKPAVETEEMEVDQLPPGLYLVDGHGNMRLVGTPGDDVIPAEEVDQPPGFVPCVPFAGSAPNPAAMPTQPPPLPVQAEAARAAMPPPETLEAYPIPKAMQLTRASKTLAEASADELLDELEVKLPAFLLACPAGSGATRFRSHGRQSEAIGLYQLLTMWMQRQMYQ